MPIQFRMFGPNIGQFRVDTSRFGRAAFGDLRPVFRDQVKVMKRILDAKFKAQGATEGDPAWAKNAPSTIAKKGHDTVLRGHPSNRGRLRRGWQRGQDNVTTIRRNGWIIINRTPYGFRHEFGDGVPLRKTITPPKGRVTGEWRELAAIPQRHVVGAARKSQFVRARNVRRGLNRVRIRARG